jgi:ATP-dependent DNA helicase RecG
MIATTPLQEIARLSPLEHSALKRLGLKTVYDLLYYFPVRYGDIAQSRSIGSLLVNDTAAIFGKITHLQTKKAFQKKMAMSSATISDETGSIKAVWFHQPYIAKMIEENAFVKVEGKITERNGSLSMVNPEVEVVSKMPHGVGDSLFAEEDRNIAYPVYAETKGISSRWIYHTLQKIFKSGILDALTDPIPTHILEQYNLPILKTALIWIHTPKKKDDSTAARKRFAFEEIFVIQLQKFRERAIYSNTPSFRISHKTEDVKKFIARFPFAATNAQLRAIEHILEDFDKPHPMSRLLEGDVGSGKTAVAAATVFAVTTTPPINRQYGSLQTAYMVPTEILAQQHFESFIQFFAFLGIEIGLITSSGCKKFPSKSNPKQATDISRTQLLTWVAEGKVPILIGTHSLIQKKLSSKTLHTLL